MIVIRDIFIYILFVFLFSCHSSEDAQQSKTLDERYPKSGQEALQRLIEGNKRFVAGESQHRHESADWRSQLTKTQKPFATILGCSDSRVPIELIFDQGFGDLFIIRVAGNVLGTDERGTIAYAVDHLHTPLILVLGHEGCGAVTAAMLPDEEKQKEAPFLQMLLKSIELAVKDIDETLPHKERIHRGVEANVQYTVQKLISLLRQYEKYNNILVVGAVYELDGGKVRVLVE